MAHRPASAAASASRQRRRIGLRARCPRPRMALAPHESDVRRRISQISPSLLLPAMYLKYVGIRVTDLDRSIKFYTELFGLKEDRRGDSRKFGLGFWVVLRDDTTGERIELNWYPPGSKYATPYTAGEGLDHLGFVVEDVREK